MGLDPEKLALSQLARDRQVETRYAGLGTRKLDRMARSPLAYLRGAAPLFYEALATDRTLAEGPPGEGTIVGDLHIENFGAYRIDDDEVVFDLNDFDEACSGPLRFDVLRLVTSLILGGRQMGFDGRRALALGGALLDSYVDVAMHGARLPPRPPPVRALCEKVAVRSRRELLDARTRLRHGERRFVRGERYADLPESLAHAARKAFAKYAAALDPAVPGDALEVLDAAFRVAGTGSLGSLRIALLTRGKGVRDGAWVFDMKEELGKSAAAIVLGARAKRRHDAAADVIAAMHACLTASPKQAGTARLEGKSMLVRRLSPQEDKLDLRRVEADDLEGLARHLGGLVGRAHRRGAKRIKPWSRSQQGSILDRATVLAALHEAAYLTMCRKA